MAPGLKSKVKEEFKGKTENLLASCDWEWPKRAGYSVERLEQYQLFLLAKWLAKDFCVKPPNNRTVLSPTKEIDEVWHAHMLCPQSYFPMCAILMNEELTDDSNRVLSHYSEFAEDDPEIKHQRIEKLLDYAQFMVKQPSQKRIFSSFTESAFSDTNKKRSRDSVTSNEDSTPVRSDRSEESKPLVEDQEIITLAVEELSGGKIFYRMKCSSALSVMMNHYAKGKGLTILSLRLISTDGEHLRPDDTPRMLGLQNGDRVFMQVVSTGC